MVWSRILTGNGMVEVGSMNDRSMLKIIVDEHNDTVIRIYDDIHKEDAGYLQISLTNRQAVKLIKDLSDTLFSKISAGGRL